MNANLSEFDITDPCLCPVPTTSSPNAVLCCRFVQKVMALPHILFLKVRRMRTSAGIFLTAISWLIKSSGYIIAMAAQPNSLRSRHPGKEGERSYQSLQQISIHIYSTHISYDKPY